MLFLHWICENYVAKKRKKGKRKIEGKVQAMLVATIAAAPFPWLPGSHENDIVAAELAEDVHVRVALPGWQAGMFVVQHVADGAHLKADGADDRDSVIFVPPWAAGRVRHCGVGRQLIARAAEDGAKFHRGVTTLLIMVLAGSVYRPLQIVLSSTVTQLETSRKK